MKETIRKIDPRTEFFTEENCFILEFWNTPEDPDVSIARARVLPGVTTRKHRLRKTTERYLILEGRGCVEVGSLPPQEVNPGDVVVVPADGDQRITNTGKKDLIFLAICSPRFTIEVYEDRADTET